MFELERILNLLPGILVGLTVHEYAHAKAADSLGDHTAAYAGRLTLNPLVHIDIIGFIMLLAVQFGWAKPVPFNPLNLKGNMRVGVVIVSMAGITANLIIAFTCAIILFLSFPNLLNGTVVNSVGAQILIGAITINLILAVFNLIPIPPLDGSKVLATFLPAKYADKYLLLERYGFLVVILLAMTGLIGKIILPIVNVLFKGILYLAGFLVEGILSIF